MFVKKMIIGGAALSEEVERCLMDVGFPIIVGYGLTECGPLIGYSDWDVFQPRSCGKVVDRMELRIDSADPYSVPGEVQVRGEAVMTGYYRNEEATRATFTDDGWLRTGDMGIVDKEGNIFLRGRNKTMLLSSSGQNIYPEEIEALLNMEPGVMESLVVQRDNKLVALVYPDMEEAKNLNLSPNDLKGIMEQNRNGLNQMLPAYEKITEIEIREEEFEKTPKRSIKRYLYT